MISAPHELPKLTEKRFQQQVVKYAELMGWRIFHCFDSRRSPAGFPDLVLVRARHAQPRICFLELKTDRGRLTDDQRAWIEELRSCGQEAYVLRPSAWPDIERLLR